MFGISRQAYYKQKRATVNKQEQVSHVVQQIRNTMPRLGTRKLYHLLKGDLTIGRDKLFTILKANNMHIAAKRSYHVTTNSKHWLKKHKNLIKDMAIDKPEQVWVSDITYLKSVNKNNYLALITDAYSKKIVGYYLSDSLKLDGVEKALKMAFRFRKYKNRELIHHSDRGLQYCSEVYQDLLKKHNVACSMTENSDPYENAIAERVNGILKQEFLLEEYKASDSLLQIIIKQAIGIYNSKRPHISCGLLTPNEMHLQDSMKKPMYRKNIAIEKILLL